MITKLRKILEPALWAFVFVTIFGGIGVATATLVLLDYVWGLIFSFISIFLTLLFFDEGKTEKDKNIVFMCGLLLAVSYLTLSIVSYYN